MTTVAGQWSGFMRATSSRAWVLLLLLLATMAPGAVALPVKINFQPTASTIPSGYLKDDGSLYANRGNGYSYGWTITETNATAQRNVNADPRLDTLIQFHAGAKWEIALPNGTYSVFVSIGDPSNASTHTLNMEGVSCWNALALTANQFANVTKLIPVSDGKLTLDQGAGAELATRINYIEISSADSTQQILTIAGNGTGGFGGNGGLATAANLYHCNGVVQDSAGNYYINDYYNHCIRKITLATGIISTVGGTGGSAGFTGVHRAAMHRAVI